MRVITFILRGLGLVRRSDVVSAVTAEAAERDPLPMNVLHRLDLLERGGPWWVLGDPKESR